MRREQPDQTSESGIERRAVYRLHLSPGFGFGAAREVLPYLAALGVSHVHLSPCFEARRGSPHGYDVTDPQRFRCELGGREGFDAFREGASELGLGVLLDIVPNHIAASPEGRWWWDVLEKGRASEFACFFDIDWESPVCDLRNRVLVPALRRPLREAIASGDVRLAPSDKGTLVRTPRLELPLAEGTLEEATGFSGDEAVRSANGDPELLEELLDHQHYLLSTYDRGPVDINYRRFFNVNALAAVRVEDDDVFDAMHALPLELFREGVVDGFRVDHPDGLRDPTGYFERLRTEAPGAWVLAEKILTGEEELRGSWPVDGTTGYEFLNALGGLFVDPRGEEAMTALYREFTGVEQSFRDIEFESKELVARSLFAPEFERLERLVDRIANSHDAPFGERLLHDGLRTLTASFGVYRTYVRADDGTADVEDAAVLDEALRDAASRRPDVPRAVWVFLRDVLLLRYRDRDAIEFAARFQQVTGPVMAKGVEDTASYVFNRLSCLNEVGGDPSAFGSSLERFHALCGATAERYPQAIRVVATHDAKRSDDTRLRIALLSEIPDAWRAAVGRWSDMNGRFRRSGAPERNDEYLFYQTLVGIWPADESRVLSFMRKAAHEAKRRTSWTNADEGYDRALDEFITRALRNDAFLGDLDRFLDPLVPAARASSLSQTLVHATAPGVPQFYQGAELWNEYLVDPDNRRPVDFVRRRAALERVEETPFKELVADDNVGSVKLAVIRTALETRARFPEAFAPGSSYRALDLLGERARHAIAFERSGGSSSVVVVAPRLVLGIGKEWSDTTVELAGAYRDVFTGHAADGRTRMAELLSGFPVALLTRRAG